MRVDWKALSVHVCAFLENAHFHQNKVRPSRNVCNCINIFNGRISINVSFVLQLVINSRLNVLIKLPTGKKNRKKKKSKFAKILV